MDFLDVSYMDGLNLTKPGHINKTEVRSGSSRMYCAGHLSPYILSPNRPYLSPLDYSTWGAHSQGAGYSVVITSTVVTEEYTTQPGALIHKAAIYAVEDRGLGWY